MPLRPVPATKSTFVGVGVAPVAGASVRSVTGCLSSRAVGPGRAALRRHRRRRRAVRGGWWVRTPPRGVAARRLPSGARRPGRRRSGRGLPRVPWDHPSGRRGRARRRRRSSGRPPRSVTTTGVPTAYASSTIIGWFSYHRGRHGTSARRTAQQRRPGPSRRAGRGSVTRPGASRAASSSSGGARGPSPATSQRPRRAARPIARRSATSTPFSCGEPAGVDDAARRARPRAARPPHVGEVVAPRCSRSGVDARRGASCRRGSGSGRRTADRRRTRRVARCRPRLDGERRCCAERPVLAPPARPRASVPWPHAGVAGRTRRSRSW